MLREHMSTLYKVYMSRIALYKVSNELPQVSQVVTCTSFLGMYIAKLPIHFWSLIHTRG